MIKTGFLLVSLALLASVVNADDLADCKCAPGQKAQQTSDGPKCLGILTKIILPCNLEQLPRCVCTGDATAVVNSATDGFYCAQNVEGKEVKRWDCENKADWDAFKEKQKLN